MAVERGLFTAAAGRGRTSRAGTPIYLAWKAAGPGMDQLSLALQQRLSDTEVQLALLFRKENPDANDLLFVDGPLRGRTHLDRTIGYIKTHHTTYLPPEQAAVVGALGPASARPPSPWARPGGAAPGTCACPAPRARRGRASSGWSARPTCPFPR